MPLYEDIATELAGRIAAEGRIPGDQIASEHELTQEFQVSRGTIVKAMDVLERRGFVRREQGRGTFVIGRPALQFTTPLISFTQFVTETGRRPGSRLLNWAVVTSSPDQSLHRPFETGIELIEFSRLRTIDGTGVGIHRVLLPRAVADSVGLENHLQRDEPWSFYALLTEAGVHLGRADERFSAVLADATTAKLLEVQRPCPLLRVERHTYDLVGRPIEVVEATYHSDRYAVTAQSTRGPAVPSANPHLVPARDTRHQEKHR